MRLVAVPSCTDYDATRISGAKEMIARRALWLGLTSVFLLLASDIRPYPFDDTLIGGNYDLPECAQTYTCTEVCSHDYAGTRQCLAPHAEYEPDQSASLVREWGQLTNSKDH
jgi:hypothetical protein